MTLADGAVASWGVPLATCSTGHTETEIDIWLRSTAMH